jgi:hypothetical protein
MYNSACSASAKPRYKSRHPEKNTEKNTKESGRKNTHQIKIKV